MSPPDSALLELLRLLSARGYRFVTPTPSTHARVLERFGDQRARNLREVFGWSLPFVPDEIDPAVLALLEAAGAVAAEGTLLKSRVRVSTVRDSLFLHSAYPTEAPDAVFLGPDTYRFAKLLEQELEDEPGVGRMADVGTGAGVGGLVAANLCPGAELILTDVNSEALRLARINLAHAGREAGFVQTSGLDGLSGAFDLIIANPPYMGSASGRVYRDGGGLHGAQLSLDWAKAALGRLAPGGRLVLYTGSAIVGGVDRLQAELSRLAEAAGFPIRYREIDPDVFGETVSEPGYEEVERIAAIGAVITRPR
ncbi:MAG TPA: class I SAM-dependent methyltransferase [Caulobacteraceae bacterium]